MIGYNPAGSQDKSRNVYKRNCFEPDEVWFYTDNLLQRQAIMSRFLNLQG